MVTSALSQILEMTVAELSRRMGWAGLGLVCLAWLWPSAGHTQTGQNPTQASLSSQVCQSCHAEIYRSYGEVAMARSFYRPSAENVIEDYTRENHFFHAPSNRHYRMVQQEGRFFQRRYRLDSDGNEKNILEREVTWIIGSGEHARSYLSLDEGGVLRQLPVTWYPQIQRWGMSPGYDRPDHEDFGRQVTHSCLFCHNGYPLLPEPSDRYGQRNVFRMKLPSGIGCHRCHGPGGDHVKLASSGTAAVGQIRQSIVNPARLSLERQLDVCLQCHLEAAAAAPRFRRSGRPVYSFKPGESLADYIVHFDLGDPDAEAPLDRFEIDSAGYRMLQSACFRQSRGALTCTTCHDPHRKLRGDQAVNHYRERCLSCHNRPSRAVHGETPPGDCTACHMPKRRAQDVVHAVMTDHLIQKRPPDRDLLAPLKEDHSPREEQPLLYFPQSLSGWERDLYVGMAEVQTRGRLRQGMVRLAAALEQKSASFTEPYVKLAMAQAETGAIDAARASLERALDIDPDSPIARFNLAEAMRRQGQYAAAMEQYRRTLALDPNYAKAHLGLGLVNRQQGRPAAESFRRAVQSDSLLAEAHLGLGRESVERRRAAEAARHFLQALRVDPDSAETHLNLGLAQARQGLQEEALEAFRQAAVQDPASPEAHYNLGVALAREGRIQEALQFFRQAVRLKPEDAEAQSNLGMAYSQLGRLQDAVAAFRQAVRLRPDSAGAYVNLGLTQARLGRTREAIEALSRSANLSPRNAEIRFHLGLVYLSAGDRASAEAQVEILKELDPERAKVLAEHIREKEQ